MNAQTTQMESQLFSLGANISHLCDNVKKKQAELQMLQRTKALSTILDTQVRHCYLIDCFCLHTKKAIVLTFGNAYTLSGCEYDMIICNSMNYEHICII
ncbi:hypothetical protein HanLR1_Chr05g0192671 [Helianthus annuus]|nr:hypothetical protein HanLR1_Chr05g0192671 [Helianthus annuus]